MAKNLILNFVRTHRIAILTISIYISSVLIISPWGNFSVNDDFYFLIQTKAFSQGFITKSAYIDPSFILQGMFGVIWGYFFGISFLSLRFPTIIFSLLSLVGFYKILKIKKINNNIMFISLVAATFNPFYYISSITYMTEIYFLTFIIWSIYYLFKYEISSKYTDLLVCSLLGGLSILVRQFGIVLLPIIFFVYYSKNKSKPNYLEILKFFIIFTVLSCVGIFWPKYTNELKPQSLSVVGLINFKSYISRIFINYNITSYIGFILLPLSSIRFFSQSKKISILTILLSLPLAYIVYTQNVFGMGNGLYLEGLYAKSYIALRTTIFNNITFKIVTSILCEVSFTTLVLALITNWKKIVNKAGIRTVLLLTFSFYIIPAFTNVLYDRYYLNFFVMLILLYAISTNTENIKIQKVSLIFIVFPVLIVFLLSLDYFSDLKMKWELAGILNQSGHKNTSIFVNDTFIKYANISESEQFSGTKPAFPTDPHFSCFVQNTSTQTPNLLSHVIEKIDTKINFLNILPITKIDGYGYSRIFAGHCEKDCAVIFKKEYFSYIQNILGRKTYVVSFCK